MNYLLLIFSALLITDKATAQNDYALDFDLFAISVGLNDTASVKTFFETDSAFRSNQWQLFEENFQYGISKYNYSDCTDSFIAGEKVKELKMEYTWTYKEEDGTTSQVTTTTYIFFKETEKGLKFIEIFNPEGGESE